MYKPETWIWFLISTVYVACARYAYLSLFSMSFDFYPYERTEMCILKCVYIFRLSILDNSCSFL